MEYRNCVLLPIPELYIAADLLQKAAEAFIASDMTTAAKLIAEADADPVLMESPIFDWSETLFYGKNLSNGKTICPDYRAKLLARVADSQKPIALKNVSTSIPARVQSQVIQRDGYFCRYCGVPVIDAKAQSCLRKAFPKEFRWGPNGSHVGKPRNIHKHVAFQALDLDLDHVAPRSLGGENTVDNLIVSCAPCNTVKAHYTLAELRLNDPRARPPVIAEGFENWNGLISVL